MSAQVTEAHQELARRIMFEFTQAGTATASDVRMAAQIIADSEARATEQANAQVESLISSAKNAIPASEHPAEPTVKNWAWQIRNLGDDRRLIYTERDQLRAKQNNLRADLDAIKAIRDEETARALRAEAEVERLRGIGCVETLIRAERAEAELDAERARLDYIDSLSPGDAWGIYRSSAQQNANLHAGDPRTLRKLPGIRAAIDAAMKEETK